ncbi:hypothetical protein IE53DRAFT_389479 [Violaceomyces palustris]|uniref:Uncharacterized protein n=1 Tax=Violaceomyces palustris TaxID=1673888 RepID=A0ACD0NRH4_9BASI|nr:hypothetical protein IE53DRAFT_389479 [Violaceomyces palustris]
MCGIALLVQATQPPPQSTNPPSSSSSSSSTSTTTTSSSSSSSSTSFSSPSTSSAVPSTSSSSSSSPLPPSSTTTTSQRPSSSSKQTSISHHKSCWLSIVDANASRGPDQSSSAHFNLSRPGIGSSTSPACKVELDLYSSVLALRGGEQVTSQPLRSHNNRYLLSWNGQVFDWDDSEPSGSHPFSGLEDEQQNDGEILFQTIQTRITKGERQDVVEAVRSTFASVEGPYAFVFIDVPRGLIIFGRDPLGRRSLLISREKTNRVKSLMIVSTASREAIDGGATFQEIDCSSLWTLDVHESINEPRPLERRSNLNFDFVLKELQPTTIESASEINQARPTKQEMELAVERFESVLSESVRKRVTNIRSRNSSSSTTRESKVAILFSGGLDCATLARLSDRFVPKDEPIDLLNVAFENPRVLNARQKEMEVERKRKEKDEVAVARLSCRKRRSLDRDHPREGWSQASGVVGGVPATAAVDGEGGKRGVEGGRDTRLMGNQDDGNDPNRPGVTMGNGGDQGGRIGSDTATGIHATTLDKDDPHLLVRGIENVSLCGKSAGVDQGTRKPHTTIKLVASRPTSKGGRGRAELEEGEEEEDQEEDGEGGEGHHHAHRTRTRSTREEEETKRYDVPDRLTARSTHLELLKLCPDRQWNLVEIDVPHEVYKEERGKIEALMHPTGSIMDLSISSALYFAARGKGRLRRPTRGNELLPEEEKIVVNNAGTEYQSQARVLVSGLGADELLGGYSRHRAAFEKDGWEGLAKELQMDLERLPTRNLGRDDRVLSSHSKEARYPFLSRQVVEHLVSLQVNLKTDPTGLANPSLPGEKLLLRQVASSRSLGFRNASRLKKRAIQFGTRSAKMEQGQGRIKGHQSLYD